MLRKEMNKVLISKKDLLIKTGISYGQLYRWKREGLIPEEWFIKQSAYTGQETFFPMEQIFERIKEIQELKNRYSLEEMANLLSPDITKYDLSVEEFKSVEEITTELKEEFLKILDKDKITYIELIVMVILEEIRKKHNLYQNEILSLFEGVVNNLKEITTTDYVFALYYNGLYYSFIYQERQPHFLDGRLKLIDKFRIEEVSSKLLLKYKTGYSKGEPEEILTGEVMGEDEKESHNEKDKKKKVIKFNNWEVRI